MPNYYRPSLTPPRLLQTLQDRYPEEFERTASHKLRSSDDMQFAFSYFYFLMSEKQEGNIEEAFIQLDTDKSGLGREGGGRREGGVGGKERGSSGRGEEGGGGSGRREGRGEGGKREGWGGRGGRSGRGEEGGGGSGRREGRGEGGKREGWGGKRGGEVGGERRGEGGEWEERGEGGRREEGGVGGKRGEKWEGRGEVGAEVGCASSCSRPSVPLVRAMFPDFHSVWTQWCKPLLLS